WPDKDAEALGSFFTDDAMYHNIPLDEARGRDSIIETLAGFMALGGTVRVDIRNLVAEGPMVVVERVDHFVRPDRGISVPIAGVFEISDGRITAWRDYFDLGQAT
ncbi:MAG TPA: limonene-1,2-epoxide hydrolase family protein, partial [Acidimicrobiales bacterium]|nr:limonene-1,2-epoxide hydrolase family protein [Acidimicrobiales bacterium]